MKQSNSEINSNQKLKRIYKKHYLKFTQTYSNLKKLVRGYLL